MGQEGQAEAEKYDREPAATSKDSNFSTIPDVKDWKLTPDAKFVPLLNETIGGVEFKDVPDVGDVPLVADMSSNYLSKPSGVQPHLRWRAEEHRPRRYGDRHRPRGPDWRDPPPVPTMFDYKLIADNDSMYNTPPCWTCTPPALCSRNSSRWAASRRSRR